MPRILILHSDCCGLSAFSRAFGMVSEFCEENSKKTKFVGNLQKSKQTWIEKSYEDSEKETLRHKVGSHRT